MTQLTKVKQNIHEHKHKSCNPQNTDKLTARGIKKLWGRGQILAPPSPCHSLVWLANVQIETHNHRRPLTTINTMNPVFKANTVDKTSRHVWHIHKQSRHLHHNGALYTFIDENQSLHAQKIWRCFSQNNNAIRRKLIPAKLNSDL